MYVVCTSCPFLRAYSAGAADAGKLEACPVCGSDLLVREREDRFPPAYVGRVSRDVLGAPELSEARDLRRA
jgi:DNA-directed RNA polymerase subunit RPC12/RpoP